MSTKNVINMLKNFTPCDISDALVKSGLRNGGFFPNLIQYSTNSPSLPSTPVGTAYTVLYAPLDDPRPAVKGGYIDNVPEDSIVVVALTPDLQTPYAPYVKINNALYGGLMSTRAKYQNANGSVIFGRVRDVNEHRALEYPVFAYGLGTTAPGPVVKVVGVNVPLEILIGDTKEVINPGEIIIGDENGVVRIPKEADLNWLQDYIPKRVAADELVAQDIKEGKKAGESQKLRRSGL